MESFPSGDLGGRLLVAAYGAVSLHHWCQRLLRLSSVTDECHFYLDILTKIIGESTVVTEEGQLRVHERRRIALKQIAALWSLVLDTFLISLFASQVLGLVKPMVGGFAFFATVSTGSIVLSRLGDPHLELTPARLNRDMTIMSFLVCRGNPCQAECEVSFAPPQFLTLFRAQVRNTCMQMKCISTTVDYYPCSTHAVWIAPCQGLGLLWACRAS
ncbi:unnamed protein product [Effrenium voratum]|nr:unnamed protein product [Effrenium voratum]